MMVFEQLKENTPLSLIEAQDLSRLLYLTDPYVYPAICDEDAFVQIVSDMILHNPDEMFNPRRLFTARAKGRVLGLILWSDGSLLWDDTTFRKSANTRGITLTTDFDIVKREYFDSYGEPSKMISLINVCVNPSCRSMHIARDMISAFINDHPERSFELVTLANNTSAIKAYEACGFCKSGLPYPGFSLDEKKPLCYKMIRP